MRDGAGPMLTIYLVQVVHLDVLKISVLLAIPTFTFVLLQIPGGVLFDRVSDQRTVLGVGTFIMLLSGLFFSISEKFEVLILIQVFIGIATCLIALGMPALSIVMSSQQKIGRRLARNEVFSKIGYFASIALMGYAAQKFALRWIFYVLALFAAYAFLATRLVPRMGGESRLDKSELKGSRLGKSLSVELPAILKALQSGGVFPLFACCFVFQFANASQFMIFEQLLARVNKNSASIVSSALFFTQIIVVIACILISYKNDAKRYLRLLRVGFLLISLRSLIFILYEDLSYLILCQLLDGIIGAILFLVPVQRIALVDEKNFNLLGGALGASVALGASTSLLAAGYLIRHYGEGISFLCFAVIGLLGYLALVFIPRGRLRGS